MWSSRRLSLSRRTLLAGGLSLAYLLSACGFVPVYGSDGTAAGLRGGVAVEGPETVEGYRLRTRIEDRLGSAPSSAAYVLTVGLSLRETGVAVTPEGAITRFTIPGAGSYALRAAGSDEVLLSGTVESFTGYSTTGSTVATQAAREDARARLAVILADLIVTRLIAAAPGL